MPVAELSERPVTVAQFSIPRLLLGQLVFLTAMAFLARANAFGDPNYHVDETFYFLVGRGIQAGEVPYLDIWDRKPPGLFLLYYVLAQFGTSVLVFQIAATAFAAATGVTICRIASRWLGSTGSLFSGVLYIAFLQPLLGGGGQAPVFYNLFTCLAVLLALKVNECSQSKDIPYGFAAAFFAGVAVSIKPTAVFEGGFVVLWFVWKEWKHGQNMAAMSLRLFGLAFVASLPLCTLVGYYVAVCGGETIWQALVESNFAKASAPGEVFLTTARYLFMILAPISTMAALGWLEASRRRQEDQMRAFVSLWLIASLAGFISVPNFYSHYALPLLPVLTVIAGRYFESPPIGRLIGFFAIGWALIIGQSYDITRGARSRAQFEAGAAVVRANLHGGPLYVFDGPPWLYEASGGHWATRFVFPEHLSNSLEKNALGVDAKGEVERILSKMPDVVVFTDSPRPTLNHDSFGILQQELSKSYHPVCAMPMFDYEHHYNLFIFARSRRPDRSGCRAFDH